MVVVMWMPSMMTLEIEIRIRPVTSIETDIPSSIMTGNLVHARDWSVHVDCGKRSHHLARHCDEQRTKALSTRRSTVATSFKDFQ